MNTHWEFYSPKIALLLRFTSPYNLTQLFGTHLLLFSKPRWYQLCHPLLLPCFLHSLSLTGMTVSHSLEVFKWNECWFYPNLFFTEQRFHKIPEETICSRFKLTNIFSFSITISFFISLVLCEVMVVSSRIQEIHTAQERFSGIWLSPV